MRSSKMLRAGSLTLVLALSLLTAGCASEDDADDSAAEVTSNSESQGEAAEVLQEALDGQDGKDERVFDTSDDDVLEVVETTLSSSNAKAQWDGTDLRVELDGSAEDPTATTPCLALESLLKDGEDAVLAYSDGQKRCSER